MRKNISAYTKINRRIYADLSAHIRLLGALLSPAVWGGKCWKKERLHLDKSESSTDCHPPRVGQSVDDLSCGGGVRLRLLQRAELTADLDEGGDSLVEVMAFVCSGELYADTCLALGDDGVVEARDVDPFFEEACSIFL